MFLISLMAKYFSVSLLNAFVTFPYVLGGYYPSPIWNKISNFSILY